MFGDVVFDGLDGTEAPNPVIMVPVETIQTKDGNPVQRAMFQNRSDGVNLAFLGALPISISDNYPVGWLCNADNLRANLGP